MSLRFAGLTLCGAAMLAACSSTPSVNQGAIDVSLLAAGMSSALAAAEAAIPAPSPTQTAQFAQAQTDISDLQAAAAAVQSATASGTTAQQIQAAITDLAPVLVAVYPESAIEVAAAVKLVPVIIAEITGTAQSVTTPAAPVASMGAPLPSMSVPEARLILKGASK